MIRTPALLSFALLLSGCGMSDWLAGDGEKTLPGERVSVLSFEKNIVGDPALAGQPVSLPPALANANWPTSGGRIDHAGGHFAVGEKLKRAWRENAGDGLSRSQPLMASPVAGGGLIFAMDSGAEVTALDLQNGRRVWRSNLAAKGERDEATGGGLSLADQTLFAATGYGEVVALKAADGVELWRVRLASPLRSAPTVADGRVYVVTIDSQLVALSAADGASLWTHQGIAEAAGLLGAAAPAVGRGMVIAAYSSGELYALDADTGRVLWSDNLSPVQRTSGVGNIAAIRGLPVLSEDGRLVLAISNAGRMVAIDVFSGQRVWEQKLGGANMPWVAGETVFVLTNDAQLVALHLRDGRVRWAVPLFAKERVWAGPVLAGSRLWLVNSKGEFTAHDPATGAEVASLKLGESTTRAPIVVGGALFVLDDDASLSAWR